MRRYTVAMLCNTNTREEMEVRFAAEAANCGDPSGKGPSPRAHMGLYHIGVEWGGIFLPCAVAVFLLCSSNCGFQEDPCLCTRVSAGTRPDRHGECV